jgi:NADH dehydrogenase
MASERTDLVTGAFSFTGRYITRRLLDRGIEVRTLTGHPGRTHAFGNRVVAHPYAFDEPAHLAASLEGIHTLFNTYWVRFDRGDRTYELAVENTRRLFAAARAAGVRRVVHVSIANPSETSALAYYRGKARLERDLVDSGLSHAILRPTVLFGDGGILINNIAWLLRRLPVFAIPGDGSYGIQPVHVDDLAKLAVEIADRSEDLVMDAAGPETYTYGDLVRTIREAIGSRSHLVNVPPGAAVVLGRLLGWLVRDVLITREEVAGLLDGLLASRQETACETRLSDWLARNRREVGHRYLSEVAMHYAP